VRNWVIILSLLCASWQAEATQIHYLRTNTDTLLPAGSLEITVKSALLNSAMGFDYQGQSNLLINGPALNFLLGLGQRADFELNWDTLRFTQTESGAFSRDISDVSFFTRILFKKETHFPSFSVRVGAKLPNASNETRAGTDLTDTFVWAILGKQIGNFHIFTNTGLEILDKLGGGQHDAFGYGFASSYAWTQKLNWVSEISGRYEKSNSPINEATFRSGISWLFTSNWKLDLGISMGMISQSETIGIRTGISKAFHVF